MALPGDMAAEARMLEADAELEGLESTLFLFLAGWRCGLCHRCRHVVQGLMRQYGGLLVAGSGRLSIHMQR